MPRSKPLKRREPAGAADERYQRLNTRRAQAFRAMHRQLLSELPAKLSPSLDRQLPWSEYEKDDLADATGSSRQSVDRLMGTNNRDGW